MTATSLEQFWVRLEPMTGKCTHGRDIDGVGPLAGLGEVIGQLQLMLLLGICFFDAPRSGELRLVVGAAIPEFSVTCHMPWSRAFVAGLRPLRMCGWRHLSGHNLRNDDFFEVINRKVDYSDHHVNLRKDGDGNQATD